MKSRKKLLGIALLLLLVVSVTIGYSFLSTTLNINGTSKIKTNTWDVHFNNVQVTNGSVTATQAPTINAAGVAITYSIELSVPGDFYEFTVDVVNGGTVDAKLSALPTISGVSTAQDVYTNYSFTHTDGSAITTLANENILAGQTKTYKVRVEFEDDIESSQLPTTAQNLTLTVQLNYEQL
ncbi:MAG: hypothetical protein J6X28_00725 [Bacilli bacterium]|nr:hypothetical protein [Bacilli bacterium]